MRKEGEGEVAYDDEEGRKKMEGRQGRWEDEK